MSLPLDKLTIAQAVFIEANRHRLVEFGTRLGGYGCEYQYFVFRVIDLEKFVDAAWAIGLADVNHAFLKVVDRTPKDWKKEGVDIAFIPMATIGDYPDEPID